MRFSIKKAYGLFFTSANRDDIKKGYALIIVDYGTLSEVNKTILREYGQPFEYDDKYEAVEIKIPINIMTTSEGISLKASEIANKFKTQKARWTPIKLEDAKKRFFYKPKDLLSRLTGEDLEIDLFKKYKVKDMQELLEKASFLEQEDIEYLRGLCNNPKIWVEKGFLSGYFFDDESGLFYGCFEHYLLANQEDEE